mmetsp:Transcript_722/g.1094  ORF Transcript_722/g.1094 Transcript_722/m.1094 type:complete len:94 (+) Transcript_722:442-723(+)|eukprot:CAMPEP_0170473836 /NCGR_PEP_ID=MMETSP0123-20130129/15679_1 /TAXON_ID=182087 /ORGANISM="Favella ehrenbergii, Strain Fehren 1" /LENGTH=93 /DNA_ID=CAMNT_0010743129 /DNA_START=1300 /DNA_END=1581 /DNA_ORIENTATION=-
MKNTTGLLEQHYREEQARVAGEDGETRKRFLDSQVEKIMAKNHSRHNSEPARKYRKAGIQMMAGRDGAAQPLQKSLSSKKEAAMNEQKQQRAK